MLTGVLGTLRLAWIALRLVFAFFGDFSSRSAFGILRRRRSANFPCCINMGGRPISIGGSGAIVPRENFENLDMP